MAALDDMVLMAEMGAGAAAPGFSGDHDCRCGRDGGTASIRGARCGSATHLRVVRVVAVVPAKISGLLLGAGG